MTGRHIDRNFGTTGANDQSDRLMSVNLMTWPQFNRGGQLAVWLSPDDPGEGRKRATPEMRRCGVVW